MALLKLNIRHKINVWIKNLNARKTYCYSKNLQMLKFSLLMFIHSEIIEHMKI